MSPVAFFAKLQDSAPEPSPAASSDAPRSSASLTAALNDTRIAVVPQAAWTPIDPKPAMKAASLDFAHNAPLGPGFKSPHPTPQVVANAGPPAPPPAGQEAPTVKTADAAVQTLPAAAPLPMPRPAEFRFAKAPEAQKPAAAPSAAPIRTAAVQAPVAAPANEPSFIEKLFGVKPATPPADALSYASLGNAAGSVAPSGRFNSVPSVGEGTAVYDISAQAVIMPNGERLEAHSGLGDKLDDVRYVHVPMRGATPPGTYTLTEREALFHGVRAIRLNPVGGSGAIFGRVGLLAHTYMLGPRGDSNGCLSFRNYDRFLQAFLRGEVRRLVVVTGRGQDALPRMVNRGRTS